MDKVARHTVQQLVVACVHHLHWATSSKPSLGQCRPLNVGEQTGAVPSQLDVTRSSDSHARQLHVKTVGHFRWRKVICHFLFTRELDDAVLPHSLYPQMFDLKMRHVSAVVKTCQRLPNHSETKHSASNPSDELLNLVPRLALSEMIR